MYNFNIIFNSKKFLMSTSWFPRNISPANKNEAGLAKLSMRKGRLGSQVIPCSGIDEEFGPVKARGWYRGGWSADRGWGWTHRSDGHNWGTGAADLQLGLDTGQTPE